ncbi:MAG: hypothetical protein ACK56F_29800, partial [bacterium]
MGELCSFLSILPRPYHAAGVSAPSYPQHLYSDSATWQLSLLRSGAGKPVFLVLRPVISRRSSGLPPLFKLHSYLLP